MKQLRIMKQIGRRLGHPAAPLQTSVSKETSIYIGLELVEQVEINSRQDRGAIGKDPSSCC